MTPSAARDRRDWQWLIGQGPAESCQTIFMIACDFHTRLQQIAMMDYKTDEVIDRRLRQEDGAAWASYAALPALLGWNWRPPHMRKDLSKYWPRNSPFAKGHGFIHGEKGRPKNNSCTSPPRFDVLAFLSDLKF